MPLRLPLLPFNATGKPSSLYLVDATDTEYDIFQDPGKGTILGIEFNPHETNLSVNHTQATRSDEARIKRVLRILGTGPYVLSRCPYECEGSLLVYFAASKFGHPFFERGGSVRLERKSQRLLAYRAPFPPDLPDVNASRPAITGPAVVARAKVILDGWMQELTASTKCPHSWASLGEPTLGYFVPKGSPTARLVGFKA